tara:strand:+ start:85 stop:957 length:873 start_codon:yes stop_codon:yes gene_type:complete
MPAKHKVSQISSEAIFAIPSMGTNKLLISILFCCILISIDFNLNLSKSIRGNAKDILQPFFYLGYLPRILKDNYNYFLTSRETFSKEIFRLKEENEKLLITNSLLEEVTKENKSLKALWGLTKYDLEKYILAKKLYISNNYNNPVLTLDISNSGGNLRSNLPVFTRLGIIGLTRSVGLQHAEVTLLHDINSKIPVISSENRTHGIVQGGGLGNQGKLINIKKTASLKEGELLLSSDLSGIFPSGFFVAKIMSIKEESDNEFLSVSVSFLDVPTNEDLFLIFNGVVDRDEK